LNQTSLWAVPLGGLANSHEHAGLRFGDDIIVIDPAYVPRKRALGVDIVIPDILISNSIATWCAPILLTHCHRITSGGFLHFA